MSFFKKKFRKYFELMQYFDQNFSQRLDSILSILRRGINILFELLEEPATPTADMTVCCKDILIEASNEVLKATNSLAMKNHISNDGEYMEVIKVLLSRIILDIGTNEADEMTKTEEQNEKENE